MKVTFNPPVSQECVGIAFIHFYSRAGRHLARVTKMCVCGSRAKTVQKPPSFSGKGKLRVPRKIFTPHRRKQPQPHVFMGAGGGLGSSSHRLGTCNVVFCFRELSPYTLIVLATKAIVHPLTGSVGIFPPITYVTRAL